MRSPEMSRRTVLQIGRLVVVGGALAACGVSQQRSKPAAVVAAPPPLTIDVMHDALVFSQAVGGTVAAAPVASWVKSLPPAQQATIEKMNEELIKEGMSDFAAGKAFTFPDLIAYDVRHVNGRDGCLLIYKGSERVAALEGPALAGLVRAAASWPAATGVTAQQALLPVAKIQDGPSAFGQSMLAPSISKTAIGTLTVDYKVTPEAPHGTTNVSVVHDNGTPLFSQKFDLVQTGP